MKSELQFLYCTKVEPTVYYFRDFCYRAAAHAVIWLMIKSRLGTTRHKLDLKTGLNCFLCSHECLELRDPPQKSHTKNKDVYTVMQI